MHEAQMHETSSFVTLTYDDEHLPEDGGLHVEHWKNFAKKFRRDVGKMRFVAAGEYGPQTLRPHWHVLLFGFDFSTDRELHKVRNGHPTYTSELLAKIWPHGFHEIGTVTYQSAAYVASYVTKKMGGKQAKETYSRTDPITGETWEVRPEFAVQSRRPGIGTKWIEEFWRDVYPRDEVIMDGRKFRPPKFYDQWLAVEKPAIWDQVRAKRLAHTNEKSFREIVARSEILKQQTNNKIKGDI